MKTVRKPKRIVVYSPHAGDVEAQKPRGTRLCNSSGALPSRALPPLPSPRFAPHRALLDYAAKTGSRNSKVGSHDFRDIVIQGSRRYELGRQPAAREPHAAL
jgi:hypothetical protein